MDYPGRTIKKGEADAKVVKAVQKRLNEVGSGPIGVDGDFGKFTLSAVRLFQARNVDVEGNPLKIDGEIGLMTWDALFPKAGGAPVTATDSALLKSAISVAASQIGIVEKPPHSNRGTQIDQYQRCVGLIPPGNYPWCAAFVYWCFEQAAQSSGKSNPLVKTAGVLDHWNRSKGKKLAAVQAMSDPSQIKPGHVFIMDFGKGNGHTGIVESVNGGYLTTIEGNTNDSHSREGYGVFRLTTRKISAINKGFINYE